jgi:hypothetical protein
MVAAARFGKQDAGAAGRRIFFMKAIRNARTWSFVALGATAILPLAVACGGSTPAANTAGSATAGYGTAPPGYPTQAGYPTQPGYPAQPQAGYPTQPGQPAGYPAQPQPGYTAQPGQPQPAPTGSAPAPLAPTDPSSLAGILQGLAGALGGQPANGGGGGGGGGASIATAGLQALALRSAPGMQQEQQVLDQQLAQGQDAVVIYTLSPGKCYTIVGFSPPGGVQDVDLNLLTVPFNTLAGQDLTHNNTPTIGASPNQMCPVIPIAVQYKLDVHARQGSGEVAVALYSKNK